jgi:hypothetical protein
MQGAWMKEPVIASRTGEDVSTGVLNSDCFFVLVVKEGKYYHTGLVTEVM